MAVLNQVSSLNASAHSQVAAVPASTDDRSFSDALAQARLHSDLRFSAHAQERLQSRKITLSNEDHERLGNAVDRASRKGGNQSLVLLDDLALIVSVQNRTVITAMDNGSAKLGAFTNIDSAVIA